MGAAVVVVVAVVVEVVAGTVVVVVVVVAGTVVGVVVVGTVVVAMVVGGAVVVTGWVVVGGLGLAVVGFGAAVVAGEAPERAGRVVAVSAPAVEGDTVVGTNDSVGGTGSSTAAGASSAPPACRLGAEVVGNAATSSTDSALMSGSVTRESADVTAVQAMAMAPKVRTAQIIPMTSVRFMTAVCAVQGLEEAKGPLTKP